MKAIQQTTNQIILKESSFLLWFKMSFGIFGLVFSITPLGAISAVVYDIGITNLRCDRITPTLVNCQKKQSKLFGLIPSSSTSFARITKAEYIYEKHSETHTDSDGDEHEHVVEYSVVELVDNDFRRMKVFSDNDFPYRSAMRNSAAEINNFIKSPAPTFFIEQDFRRAEFLDVLPIIAFLSIFSLPGIIGIIMICAAIADKLHSETFIFNKSSQLLTHKMGKGNVSTEPFINFQALQIIEETSSDNDKYYHLELLYKSGNKNKFFGSSSSSLPSVEEVAIKLGDFLQIPVNKIMLDKVNETERDLN